MQELPSDRATQIMQAAAAGDHVAADQLLPLVYEQLRKAAQQKLGGEREDHTLQATALVHEAYLRLAGPREIPWRDRGHFYKAAAEAMRRILIDHARSRARIKRGGGRCHLDLEAGLTLAGPEKAGELADILAIEEALVRLEERDLRAAEVVRLRFYTGLEVKEVAVTLGISERSVRNDWAFARAWLARELNESDLGLRRRDEGANMGVEPS